MNTFCMQYYGRIYNRYYKAVIRNIETNEVKEISLDEYEIHDYWSALSNAQYLCETKRKFYGGNWNVVKIVNIF